MSHVLRTIEHVPFHRDPILAAIDAHDEAWAIWQTAPEACLLQAHSEMEQALARVLATRCATRFGSVALLRHLRWHIEHDGITDASVHARVADLVLYLNVDFPAVEPARSRLAPVFRALAGSGELLAAIAVIVCGMAAVGAASLI